MLYNRFRIPSAAQQGICKHIDKLFLFFQGVSRTLNSEVKDRTKDPTRGPRLRFFIYRGSIKGVKEWLFSFKNTHVWEKKSSKYFPPTFCHLKPTSPPFSVCSLAEIAQGQNTWSFVGEHYKVMQKVYLVILWRNGITAVLIISMHSSKMLFDFHKSFLFLIIITVHAVYKWKNFKPNLPFESGGWTNIQISNTSIG